MAIRKAYQEQLQTLRDELMQMGSLCVQAVQLSIQAVTTGEKELAEQTQKTGEMIDKKERDIESLCLRLLLQQQPVAADLRHISSALKMISDLERIGDQAVDIAEISSYVILQKGSSAEDLRAMADEGAKMVRESIIAYIKNDLVLAREVISWDDTVDKLFVHIKDGLISSITADNTQGEYFLELFMAAKYLERIGDHAVNVAEWVEYSILGRHPRDDKMTD